MSEDGRDAAARPSILLADDEKDLLSILEEFLRDSHDLTLASDGLDAIEKLKGGRFDLVVTDINMPRADGLAVLKAAKEADPELEVIILTGNATTATAIDALRQGAYDYVLKPFDLFEMEQTVSQALERRRLREENRRFTGTLQAANQELTESRDALRRHRDELRVRVEEATRRIRTLYEVGQEITSTLNLERTLALVLDRSLELTGAAEGALLLPDDDGRYRCRVVRGATETENEHVARHLAADPLHEQVRSGGQALQGRLMAAGGPGRSALIVPFLREGEVRGTVAVLRADDTPFTLDDRELLSGLAAQASIAIHNAQVYDQIRQLERMKSDFVAVVSHELRTPLTAIKGTLEILSDDRYFPLPPQGTELLDICRVNSERLEALVNDILDLSKLESSRLSSHFVLASIPSLVQSVVVQLGRLAESKRIKLAPVETEGVPYLAADEMRIVQVLNNLISNAIKFSPEETTVTIETARQEEGVVVRVRDQGVGIAPEDLPKLFNRFRQLDSSSTRRAGGTGLGLVISKGIIEEHQGRIWAESIPGTGSTFSFWLPARAPAADPDSPECGAAPPPGIEIAPAEGLS